MVPCVAELYLASAAPVLVRVGAPGAQRVSVARSGMALGWQEAIKRNSMILSKLSIDVVRVLFFLDIQIISCCAGFHPWEVSCLE